VLALTVGALALTVGVMVLTVGALVGVPDGTLFVKVTKAPEF
jgi:hypothetical protein